MAKEKFSKVFENINISESLLDIFSKSSITRIAVNRSTMQMTISIETPDIISKSVEISLKETILSEFSSISDVQLEITQDFSDAEDIFGTGVDIAEEMALFDS